MATEIQRKDRLLECIRSGLELHTAHTSSSILGDRSKYVGMSDIGSYMTCPRMAVLHKFQPQNSDNLQKLLTLQRGHWFEDGIAKALSALNLPAVRQLEIAVDNDGCPVRAHLDFVLVSVQPCPTVRVLEVKSCGRLPDTLYASYEAQAYGQISMLNRYWNTPSFNLLIFQIFTKQYLAKLLHCMAWNYQAAKQKTFGSTGDCGQWNFLKAV